MVKQYGFLVLIGIFFLYRFLRFQRVKKRLPELLSNGAQIVDVRSANEFLSGSSAGSVNIPLSELSERASELDPTRPVVLCCASGTRSGMAAGILKVKGFKVVLNAGPWTNTR